MKPPTGAAAAAVAATLLASLPSPAAAAPRPALSAPIVGPSRPVAQLPPFNHAACDTHFLWRSSLGVPNVAGDESVFAEVRGRCLPGIQLYEVTSKSWKSIRHVTEMDLHDQDTDEVFDSALLVCGVVCAGSWTLENRANYKVKVGQTLGVAPHPGAPPCDPIGPPFANPGSETCSTLSGMFVPPGA